eukprot:403331593
MVANCNSTITSQYAKEFLDKYMEGDIKGEVQIDKQQISDLLKFESLWENRQTLKITNEDKLIVDAIFNVTEDEEQNTLKLPKIRAMLQTDYESTKQPDRHKNQEQPFNSNIRVSKEKRDLFLVTDNQDPSHQDIENKQQNKWKKLEQQPQENGQFEEDDLIVSERPLNQNQKQNTTSQSETQNIIMQLLEYTKSPYFAGVMMAVFIFLGFEKNKIEKRKEQEKQDRAKKAMDAVVNNKNGNKHSKKVQSIDKEQKTK